MTQIFKKLFPGLIVAAAISANASGFRPEERLSPLEQCCRFTVSPVVGNTDADVAGDTATSTFTYGYCGAPVSALKAPERGKKFCSAIALDDRFTEKYAGMRIVAVRIANGYTCSKMPMTVFVSRDLQEFTYEQSVKMSTPAGEEVTYQLDRPFEIVAGDNLLVGFSAKGSSAYQGPIVYDGKPNGNPDSFLLAEPDEDGRWVWYTLATDYGANCIRVVVEGRGLPRNDATISLESIGYVTLGNNVELPVMVTNTATNPIDSLTFAVAIGDENTIELTVGASIPERDMQELVRLSVPCVTVGLTVPVVVKLLKVNGVEVKATEQSVSRGKFICLPADEVYERAVVMEEGTGTWCKWCPRGAVTMERLSEMYADGEFIPVAVHKSDPMQAPTYAALSFGSFPQAAYNRDRSLGTSVDLASALKAVDEARKTPAILKVMLKASTDSSSCKMFRFESRVIFAGDASDADYRMAYVITENGVGPYPQQNGYAGGAEQMGGWESLPEVVPAAMFGDVARAIFSCQGIEGSLPSEIEAGVEYDYSYVGECAAVTTADSCRFVAMVINAATGQIENAVSVPVTYESAGIDRLYSETGTGFVTVENSTVTVCGNVPVSILTPDGRRVSNLAVGQSAILTPGLYVVASQIGSRKIIIR